MTSSLDEATPPKHCWYTPTPAKFVSAVFLMQGVLFLSSRYHWFWFNERKGYTVLITVAATAALLLLMLVGMLLARLFKAKSQFSLSVLLSSVLAMTLPLGWLGSEIHLARQQRATVANLVARGDYVSYEEGLTALSYVSFRVIPMRKTAAQPALHRYLEEMLGQDFFNDAYFVSSVGANDETIEMMRELNQLRAIQILNATVTDAGIARLKGLAQLRSVILQHTKVTERGVAQLKESLPECKVEVQQ